MTSSEVKIIGNLLMWGGMALCLIAFIATRISRKNKEAKKSQSVVPSRTVQKVSPKPAPAPAPQPSPVKAENTVCPVCGREDYRTENFCIWCGATFDAKGQVIPNVITRAHDYFRHPWDVSSVETYDTLSDPLHHMFFSYLAQGLPDCTVQPKVAASSLFPTAMPYAMPINFLVSKGDKKVAVLLIERARCKRYSLLETKELCKENGITALNFYFEFDNEENYVVERIKKALE